MINPLMMSRENNAETLKQLEKSREDLRTEYFKRVSKQLMEGASRTIGPSPTPGVEEPSRSSGSAELHHPNPSEQLRAKLCIELWKSLRSRT